MPAGAPVHPGKQLFDAINQQIAQINNWIRSVATPKESWQTPVFGPNWEDYGSGWAPVGCVKDVLGFVHVRGLARAIGEVTYGYGPTALIATLPAGFRPGGGTLIFAQNGEDSNGAGFYRVDLTTAGGLYVRARPGFTSATPPAYVSVTLPPFLAEN
jgi:hypothetical protein